MGGRGSGKTRAGSEWVLSVALSEPDIYVGVCAPTFAQVRDICLEGKHSGILNVAQPGEILSGDKGYNRSNLQVKLRNGSIIQGFSAQNPDSIRGADLSYAWIDELAMIQYVRFYDYGLRPALRHSPKNNPPRLLITTTPKRSRLIRGLLDRVEKNPGEFHYTRSISDENPYFDATSLRNLKSDYAGSYLEKQELQGEYIGEADGALFRKEDFNEFRVYPGEEPSKFRSIVVAIDPAVSTREGSDETGIVVAGEGDDAHFYCLEDCSLQGTVEQQMGAVNDAYLKYQADFVVAEQQGVKDYMRFALEAVNPHIPLKLVPAQKGKLIRAQPISILAAQGKIHMVGDDFEELENQLSEMTADEDRSKVHDDRADAYVYAMRSLSSGFMGSYKEAYGFYPCIKCGEDVNEQLEKKCRYCGTPVADKTPAPSRAHGTRWADAYQQTCKNGHVYSKSKTSCPACENDPSVYLAAIARFGGGNTPVRGYTGRDWFAGRRT